MGEARNRRITEIYPRNFYGKGITNFIRKGRPIIQISPEGVTRNYPKKQIFVPWTEISTIFNESLSIPGSICFNYVIGITVSDQYAKRNYENTFSIKKIIRKSEPFTFSDGISGTTGTIRLNHNFNNEKVVLYINHKELKHDGKIFTIY